MSSKIAIANSIEKYFQMINMEFNNNKNNYYKVFIYAHTPATHTESLTQNEHFHTTKQHKSSDEKLKWELKKTYLLNFSYIYTGPHDNTTHNIHPNAPMLLAWRVVMRISVLIWTEFWIDVNLRSLLQSCRCYFLKLM